MATKCTIKTSAQHSQPHLITCSQIVLFVGNQKTRLQGYYFINICLHVSDCKLNMIGDTTAITIQCFLDAQKTKKSREMKRMVNQAQMQIQAINQNNKRNEQLLLF